MAPGIMLSKAAATSSPIGREPKAGGTISTAASRTQPDTASARYSREGSAPPRTRPEKKTGNPAMSPTSTTGDTRFRELPSKNERPARRTAASAVASRPEPRPRRCATRTTGIPTNGSPSVPAAPSDRNRIASKAEASAARGMANRSRRSGGACARSVFMTESRVESSESRVRRSDACPTLDSPLPFSPSRRAEGRRSARA